MSARPRPVTATVTKPKNTHIITSTPKKGISLSPGSSTESLVSVLDHDSYVSPFPSDGEVEETKEKKNGENNKESKTSTHSKSEVDSKETEKGRSRSEDSTTVGTDYSITERTAAPSSPSRTPSESQHHQQPPMSPWEKWLIQKAKDLRITQRREIQLLKKKKEEEEQKKREQNEKQKIIDEKLKQWMEQKSLEEKLRTKMEKRKIKTEAELAEEEKTRIKEKAEKKYMAWLETKQSQLTEYKRKQREIKRAEKKKNEEKKQKCQETYDKWLKEAKTRPKTLPNSFGYSSGKLTGYYDKSSYPTPTFYNPIPWQPIHVPQPKTQRKKLKTKVKKRWDPSKYL